MVEIIDDSPLKIDDFLSFFPNKNHHFHTTLTSSTRRQWYQRRQRAAVAKIQHFFNTKVLVFNAKSIIFNAKFIILNANRYLLPLEQPDVTAEREF